MLTQQRPSRPLRLRDLDICNFETTVLPLIVSHAEACKLDLQWDVEPPHLFNEKRPYGEVNSCGPDTAFRIHTALRERIEEYRASLR